MLEERYRATTQNRFYPDMSNVLINKKYYIGGKTYQPTYVCNFLLSPVTSFLSCPNIYLSTLSSKHPQPFFFTWCAKTKFHLCFLY